MNQLDKELKQIRYEKYLICMQIKELKKQLAIKKQQEQVLEESMTRSRKRKENRI